MKKDILKWIIFGCIWVLLPMGCKESTNPSEEPILDEDISDTVKVDCMTAGSCGVFIDSRDLNEYRWIKINGATWLAENLRYEADGSLCYEQNSEYCEKYGRLYQWTQAMELNESYLENYWSLTGKYHQGICPEGWHVSTIYDWHTLINEIYNLPKYQGEVFKPDTVSYNWEGGQELADSLSWNVLTYKGTDVFSFSLLASGYGYESQLDGKINFYGLNKLSQIWIPQNFQDELIPNKSEDGFVIANSLLPSRSQISDIYLFTSSKKEYHSVRCVKDE